MPDSIGDDRIGRSTSVPQDGGEIFVWGAETPPRDNYRALGQALAMAGDLFRRPNGPGLISLSPNHEVEEITTAADLLPTIIDRLNLIVVTGSGKVSSGAIPKQHLDAMLRSDVFLRHFLAVNAIVQRPIYLDNFHVVERGYNQTVNGWSCIYFGPEPEIAHSTDAIDKFLDVMAFATTADRTNVVAAALTVMFRNHWPGAKPVILATASKSHAGKDTIISFAVGVEKQTSISYQSTDWGWSGVSWGR